MAGWGDFFGKIADWVPGRKESIANRIENLKRKLNEIQNRKPYSSRDAIEYGNIAEQLRQAEQQAKNN